MSDITDKVQCLGCRYHKKYGHTKERVSSQDECGKVSGRIDIRYLIDNTDKFKHNGINASDCEHKFIVERIRNSILWLRLYFKGLEKEPIVLEANKHEIFINARWSVRMIAGMADKFHAWQDRRREKRWIATEAKRKAQILTHIVKELPRA